MQLFADKAEQVWVQDGLALQIKLFTKQRKGQDEASSTTTTTTTLKRKPNVPTNVQDEIYFLYPEHSVIDRARDCADEYGKCSLEEMQDLIPSKCVFCDWWCGCRGWIDGYFFFVDVETHFLVFFFWCRNVIPLVDSNEIYLVLRHHREMAALHKARRDETDASVSCLDNDDEIKWLQEGLELQITLRQPARRRMERK